MSSHLTSPIGNISSTQCVAPRKIVAPKHTIITPTPHIANTNPPYLQNFSNLVSSTCPCSIGFINKYPNSPGKINDIDVDPVLPTNANTLANEVTDIATR